MIGRVTLIAVAALVSAASLRAQESVFNLPAFGVPGTGASIRARGMGGAGLGLEVDPFSLEAPAQLTRFQQAAFHLSVIGQRTDVEDADRSSEIEDMAFPMGQLVVPAWKGTALGLGYYQFVDFDAAIESTILFEGDTLPASLRSEGGISVLAPAAGWAIDDRTAVGLSLDLYLGSRLLIRELDTADVTPGAIGTVDSVSRDYRAAGFTLSAERRLGRGRVAAIWRWRPSVDSRITVAPGGGLVGRSTEFDLPSELTIGGSSRLSRRMIGSAVLRWSDWGGVEDPAGGEFGSSVEVGGGIELEPASRALWLFGPDTPLRAGLRWRRLPLRVEGEPVDEWTASLGYGRSFLAGLGRIDLVLEAGRRGDVDTVGIRESFLRLGVGLSAFEQWRRDAPPGP